MFGQPSSFAVLDVEPTAGDYGSRRLVREYLLKHEPEFARLNSLRQKGWNEESGDTYFQERRQRARTADPERFYKNSQAIAAEMNNDTGALSFDDAATPQVLDLCMAPGGYSATVLRLNPNANIDAVSLPPADGGYEVLLPFGSVDPRVCVTFADITMLATEYGVNMKEFPTDHPDAQKLTSQRPYHEKQYDLVICDGQVPYGKSGGTFVILLHKLDSFPSMMLIRSFCAFATVKLFKPKRGHTVRSSFYMVAKNVRPHSAEAEVALNRYKSFWYNATFGAGPGLDEPADDDQKREDVKVVLEEFGPELVELGRNIWTTQADALEIAPFMRHQLAPKGRNEQGR